MRKLHLLAAIVLIPLCFALSQSLFTAMEVQAQNTQCSDRPLGDSSNACADTRFVQNAVTPIVFNVSNAVFSPTQIRLSSGKILIGTATNVANEQLMSGSCTITNAGVITCPASGVTQITAGTDIVLSPSPITGSGSISVGPNVTRTIGNGVITLTSSAIGSGICAVAQTATATGTAATDGLIATFGGDPTSNTGFLPSTSGMLTIFVWPTTNTVNLRVCNNTAGSITPAGSGVLWRVVR